MNNYQRVAKAIEDLRKCETTDFAKGDWVFICHPDFLHKFQEEEEKEELTVAYESLCKIRDLISKDSPANMRLVYDYSCPRDCFYILDLEPFSYKE